MLMKPAELALLKRGRRHFILPTHPGWETGKVVRLRTSARDEGFPITVVDVVEVAGGFKISFTPGDSREEKRYIAAGHPDYTTDPFRAMRDELPPMPETSEEQKTRAQWLKLALASSQPPSRKRAPAKSRRSHRAPVKIMYAADLSLEERARYALER